VDPVRIMELSQTKFSGLRLTPDYRLSVSIPGLGENEIIDQANYLLGELEIEERKIF